ELFNQVHLLCGDPNHLGSRLGPTFSQLVNDCRGIAGLVALSPWQRLGGARIIDVAQPFTAGEWETATKVRDLLLAGDESCSQDEHFAWAKPISKIPTPAHVALAGLRSAFDLPWTSPGVDSCGTTLDSEMPRKLWVRFWCLMQFITGNTEPTRER